MTQSPSSPPRPSIAQRVRTATDGYPRQFWLLFWGILISSSAGSMVWPFLTIYMRERLQAPLSTITLLLTLNGVMGIAATFIAGGVLGLPSGQWSVAISTTPSRLWQFGMEG